MPKLPVKTALRGLSPLESGRAVVGIMPQSHGEGAAGTAIAVSPESLGSSFGAIAAAEEREKNNALGLIKADAERKWRLRFDTGPEPESAGPDAVAITDQAAQHIPDQAMRTNWAAMVAPDNDDAMALPRRYGSEGARRRRLAEIDTAFAQLGALYDHSDTDEAERGGVLSDMNATATAAERVIGPDAARRLRERHIGGAVYREAKARLWSDPDGLIADLAFPPDGEAERGAPASAVRARYQEWLLPGQIEDLHRRAYQARSLIGRQELAAAWDGSRRGLVPDPAVFERTARALPRADVEGTRRAIDASLRLHQAVAPLGDMDPADAASHAADRPDVQPAWMAIQAERTRDPVRALSGAPVQVQAGLGPPEVENAQRSVLPEEDWTFQLSPAREIAEVEAVLAARAASGRRQQDGPAGAQPQTPSLTPAAIQDMRITARLAAQARLMPGREAEWKIISRPEAGELLPLPDEARRSESAYRQALHAAYERAYERYGPKYAERAVREAAAFQRDTDKEAAAATAGRARVVDELAAVQFTPVADTRPAPAQAPAVVETAADSTAAGRAPAPGVQPRHLNNLTAAGFEAEPLADGDKQRAPEQEQKQGSDAGPSGEEAPPTSVGPAGSTPTREASISEASRVDGDGASPLWPPNLTDAPNVLAGPGDDVDTGTVLAQASANQPSLWDRATEALGPVRRHINAGLGLADHAALGIPSTAAGLLANLYPYRPYGSTNFNVVKAGAHDALDDAKVLFPNITKPILELLDKPYSPHFVIGTMAGPVAAKNLERLGITAPQRALDEAQRMRAAGRSQQEIWDKTAEMFAREPRLPFAGVVYGYDGMPRFEINDRFAWRRLPLPPPGFHGDYTLDQILHHPYFFKAYPDARNVEVKVLTPPSNLRAFEWGGWYSPGQPGRGVILHTGDDTKHSGHAQRIVGHEFLGHLPQELEGFAKGGGGILGAPHDFLDQIRRELDQINDAAGRPRVVMSDEDLAKYIYQRVVGEIEARNVAARMHMNLAERRSTPPRRTEDIQDAPRFLTGVNIPGTQIVWNAPTVPVPPQLQQILQGNKPLNELLGFEPIVLAPPLPKVPSGR